MKHLSWLLILCIALIGCATPAQAPVALDTRAASGACTLRLATTTSTADSGLLASILPDFEKQFNCKVQVIAVGTGQALEIGSKGDADVVLVHARAQEDKFVADGHAARRYDVMYNDFIILGPENDPAQVGNAKSAKDALQRIASTRSLFASRGDKSGTNTKELSIWASTGVTPSPELGWYNSLGQGMGETLIFANEKQAYTLSDRGTYLSMQARLLNLRILLGGNSLQENQDKSLLNSYGVMAVSPEKHPGVNFAMATQFIQWITSPDTQKLIGRFGVDKFGQPLFYPNATVAAK